MLLICFASYEKTQTLTAQIYGRQGRQIRRMETYSRREEESTISTTEIADSSSKRGSECLQAPPAFTVFHPATLNRLFKLAALCFQHLTVLERRSLRPDFGPRYALQTPSFRFPLFSGCRDARLRQGRCPWTPPEGMIPSGLLICCRAFGLCWCSSDRRRPRGAVSDFSFAAALLTRFGSSYRQRP